MSKKYECEERPNLWALKLMELMAENLFMRSDLLNDAYRHCISVLGDEVRRHRGPRLVEREDERDVAGRGL